MFNKIKQNELLFDTIICSIFSLINLNIFGPVDSLGAVFFIMLLFMPFALILFLISIVSTLLIISGLVKKRSIDWLILPFIISTGVCAYCVYIFHKWMVI